MSGQPHEFTLAHHAHGVGWTWLWGPGVLSRTLGDLLAWLPRSGVRLDLDCDAAALQQLATEDPHGLERLRRALAAGELEIVGGTWGQPVGLFHGGESHLRQRLLGLRNARRLLGVWPQHAWSGTFEFFPQLPQLLSGCGYRGACLLAPTGRATPTLPHAQAPLFQWEGLDGTRLPCAAADGDSSGGFLWLDPAPTLAGPPDLVLELERLVERLREAGGELRWTTLGQRIAGGDLASAPVRAWDLDEFFHGASLGKNADCIPRLSRTCEEQLLAAEGLSTLLGLFGRPYASWDIYPHWELEQAWQDLCRAQHHVVHELEGLCGAIGERYLEKSLGLSGEVFARTLEHLALRVDAPEGSTLVYNTLGWTRDVALSGDGGGGIVRDVPAFGYRVVDPYDIEDSRLGSVDLRAEGDLLSFERRHFRVEIDRNSGMVTQIYSREFPDGLLHPDRPVGDFRMLREGKLERFERVTFEGETAGSEEWAEYTFLRESQDGSRLRVVYGLAPLHDALWVRVVADPLQRPDAGMHAGLSLAIAPRLEQPVLLHDHPFAITRVRAERDGERSYPTGEWLAPERVREVVRRPFTSSSLVDQCAGSESGPGLLVVHDGSQAWFAEEHGARCLLSMYDAWDEDYFDANFEVELALIPHGRLSNTARMRTSMELNLGSPRFADHVSVRGGGDLPPDFGALALDAVNVLASSLARVGARDAEHLEGHFATRFGVRDPFVVRLVEFDGRAADVVLRLPGSIAAAARTDHLGRVLEVLEPSRARAPYGPRGMPWSAVRLSLRAREVATLMFDLELGRRES